MTLIEFFNLAVEITIMKNDDFTYVRFKNENDAIKFFDFISDYHETLIVIPTIIKFKK